MCVMLILCSIRTIVVVIFAIVIVITNLIFTSIHINNIIILAVVIIMATLISNSVLQAFAPVLLGTCAVMSLANILGTVALAPLLGISPDMALAATMRCVTIPMALPTYAVLCEASGGENNVAFVALCAGAACGVAAKFESGRPALLRVDQGPLVFKTL